MSYLSNPTSKTEYGVVQVGANVNVVDGIVSIPQSVDPTASVSFDSISVATALSLNGNSVVTSVTPTAGTGIALSSVVTSGPATTFSIANTGVVSAVAGAGISVSSATGAVTIANTGVLRLTAGSGITLSGSTGNITISADGADIMATTVVSSNYTATASDEYIGVDTNNPITITLPAGTTGRVYTIKDERGSGNIRITIQPQSSEKIDNKANYVITTGLQSVSVVFRGGQWRII
jgi:hypothetical protein